MSQGLRFAAHRRSDPHFAAFQVSCTSYSMRSARLLACREPSHLPWHAQCFSRCIHAGGRLELAMDSRASLLIVDDERGPTESRRMGFKSEFEVYTAPGGHEALEILQA